MDKCVEYVVVERRGQTLSVYGGDSFNILLSPLATIPSLQYPAKGRESEREKKNRKDQVPHFPFLQHIAFTFSSSVPIEEMNKGMLLKTIQTDKHVAVR